MPNDQPPTLSEWRDEIGARRRTLERRLDDGYLRIDQALRSGEDIDAWEDFWIHLLHEYESVCDDIGVEDLAA